MGKLWVQYRGGLGNQLFSWASGFAVAKKIGCEVVLVRKSASQPKFELREFSAGVAHRWRDFTPLEHRLLSPVGMAPRERPIRERDAGFDPIFESLRPGQYVAGYLQSPRYFVDFASEVKKFLRGLRAESPALKEYRKRLGQTDWIAVHVRLGDYLRYPETYVIPSPAYYSRALQHAMAEVPHARIVLFSDDVAAARKLVPQADETVGAVDLHSSVETMTLMSEAHSLIGANSTLSWWAAFAGPGLLGRNVFPSRWFSDPALSADELLLPEFIVLDPSTGR